MSVERELEAIKNRGRSLRPVRFFGVLFAAEMLKETIIHERINKLLNCLKVYFECFYRLLPACEKQLDTEEAKVGIEVNILAVFILGYFLQHGKK